MCLGNGFLGLLVERHTNHSVGTHCGEYHPSCKLHRIIGKTLDLHASCKSCSFSHSMSLKLLLQTRPDKMHHILSCYLLQPSGMETVRLHRKCEFLYRQPRQNSSWVERRQMMKARVFPGTAQTALDASASRVQYLSPSVGFGSISIGVGALRGDSHLIQ